MSNNATTKIKSFGFANPSNPKFQNNANLKAVKGSNEILIKICLFVSTITSAICCTFFLYALLGHRNEMLGEWYAIAFYGVSALAFCYYIDKGVKHYGTFFLTEFMSLMSGRFYFGLMRVLYMTLVSIPFLACFFLSYFTSKDGAKIVASVAQPIKIEGNLNTTIANEVQARNTKLKPYQETVQDLQDQKEAALKSGLGSDSYKLYKKGNAWVRTEFSNTIAKIDKDFNAKIKTAESNLDKATKDFESLAGAHNASSLSSMERQKEQSQNSFDAIVSILNMLGVLPLLIALALLGLISIQEVVEAINRLPAKQQSFTHNPTQKDEEDFF